MKNSASLTVFNLVKEKIYYKLKRDYEELNLLQSSYNSTENFANSALKRIDRIIIESIQKYFPDHKILSSVSGEENPQNEYNLWRIEPLTDIMNFAHALPFSTVSIVYQRHDEKTEKLEVQSVMSFVIGSWEMYYSEKDNGAWVEDLTNNSARARLRVSNRSKDSQMLVITDKQKKGAQSLIINSKILPFLYLASGKVDFVSLDGLSIFEKSIAEIFARESGGDVNSKEIGSEKFEVTASNQKSAKFFNL